MEKLVPGARERAVWIISPSCLDVLDQLSVTTSGTTYPLVKYHRAGEPPTIKGRPLLISEFASPVGTPGDLIAVDLSQYLFTWMRYPSGAGLSFDFQPVTDQWHQGLIGMKAATSTSATSSCSIATKSA